MRWYMVESFAPDATPIYVREKYDFVHLEKMPVPQVGAHIEYAIEGNEVFHTRVKALVWDTVRGSVRVIVEAPRRGTIAPTHQRFKASAR